MKVPDLQNHWCDTLSSESHGSTISGTWDTIHRLFKVMRMKDCIRIRTTLPPRRRCRPPAQYYGRLGQALPFCLGSKHFSHTVWPFVGVYSGTALPEQSYTSCGPARTPWRQPLRTRARARRSGIACGRWTQSPFVSLCTSITSYSELHNRWHIGAGKGVCFVF